MGVEYEITSEDLFAFQWRAYRSPLLRRARRKVYIYWFLALLLMSLLPAIGTDGFIIARANFTFLAVAYPMVALIQWLLGRWATWDARFGILPKRPNLARLFDFGLAP